MAYDPEKVIKIATRLKAAKEQVAVLEEQLRSLILESGQNGQLAPRRRRGGLSEAATKIVSVLKTQPNKGFSAQEIWQAAGLEESYVRPLLSRLAGVGSIEKRGRGLYGVLKEQSLEQ